MKHSIIIALFFSTFVWSQEKVIFVAKNENIKSTKVQIENGILYFELTNKLSFLHVPEKHLQEVVYYSNISDNIISDLENFELDYKNKIVNPFIFIEFVKGSGSIFEVEFASSMQEEILKENTNKIPDILEGSYMEPNKIKNTQGLIDEIIIVNDSCYLLKEGQLYNSNNIKLEYNISKKIAAKFRIGRFKLSLMHSNKIYLRDNLCMGCPRILFLVLIVSCNTTIKQNRTTDDYALVNAIIKTTKEQSLDKTIVFKLDNNNEYVVSILNQLYKYELDNNLDKLDSLKQGLGIIKSLGIIKNLKEHGRNDVDQKDPVFDSIFNKKQYAYLISQKYNSKWDINLVDKSFLEKADNKSTQNLRITKPIYTTDNKSALIYFNQGTIAGVLIYKKMNGKWASHGLINPLLLHPKAEIFIYND